MTEQRLRFDLAYDGTDFHGWAAQPGQRTVQGELERVLGTICRQAVSLTVAGRTDAGVHATGQVAHLDLPASLCVQLLGHEGERSEKFAQRLNSMLAREASGPRGSADVQVKSVRLVDASFDARFSALRRRYTYRIADSLAARNPLTRHWVSWVDAPAEGLNLPTMNQAARTVLGEHDFLSFCKPREGATTIRTLTAFSFTRAEDDQIEADVQADAFCHSMVRSLVGAAILVGRGARPENYLAELLKHPSREQAAPLAPPQGLVLAEVSYGEDADAWAQQAQLARRRRDEADCDCEKGSQ
ncbi:tRNA pseudouridine(38-40) synthase TruA [Boudabousia marimammalium]|uniref:tRNA pseudouridine(38-40) synthase TruA n=1 Tax=Boudabousia marimammalium TaxID=156892 RepID=UPI0009FEA2CE|nr:tRNA pseudouridine(38-40) synthase TruA [Boudabousia marimammalium]